MKQLSKGLGILLVATMALGFAVSCSSPLDSFSVGNDSAVTRVITSPWTAGTAYTAGDVVSYNSLAWTCRQAHTALLGWEPPNVPALWLQGGTIEASTPETPAGLAARADSTSSLTITWTARTGATSYDIEADGVVMSSVTSPWTHRSLQAESSHTYRVRANNSVGSSAWSTAVTGLVHFEPGTGSSLPTHILTGYWHNFNNGATILRISEVPTTYTIIAVSFADATTTPGAVDFTLDPGLGFTEAQFKADIAAVKARGQHVIISVGGQNGSIRVADSTSAQNFASSINSLMDEYGFEGVDIDLENGVNAQYMAEALRKVKAGAIITMAPETIGMQSTGNDYFKLALAIKDILTIVNMQYYNSGSMLGHDGKVYTQGGVDFLTALATIQLEGGLRPDQVGIGLPASSNGASSGYVDPSILIAALDTLAYGSRNGTFVPPRTYPSIRGAMTWSINWDASNNWNFSTKVGGKLAAMNGQGQTDTQAPSTPTNFTASSSESSALTLTWTGSTDNMGVTAYEVTWQPVGGSAQSSTVSGTSTQLTGLNPSTSYALSVKARDAAGNWSSTATANATTASANDSQIPGLPGSLTASSVSGTSVTLSWTAATDNVGVSTYHISWAKADGTGAGTSTTSGLSAHLSALTPGVSYTAQVRAQDAAGNVGTAASVSFTTTTDTVGGTEWAAHTAYALNEVVTYQGTTYTCRYAHTALPGWEPPNVLALWLPGGTVNTGTAPNTPATLSAMALGTTSLSVTWSAASTATTYDLEVDGVVRSAVTSPWTHTGLAQASTHTYRVRANNSHGSSPWSAPVQGTTSSGQSGTSTRIMSGYWHTWGGGAGGGVPFVKLRDVNPAWDVINVSFAEPVSPGSTDGRMKFVIAGLDTSYTLADFKADIKTLQASGKKIVLAIGGYEGYFSLGSASAVVTFVAAIKGFINEYGFDGIDIDLEQSSLALASGADPDFRNPTSPKVVNMISAIRQICDAYGSSFILSWAPETFYLQLGHQFYAGNNPYVDNRAGCYIPMIHALRDKTTYVQAQLYNSGPIVGNDGVSYNTGSVEGIVALTRMLLEGFTVNGSANAFFPGLRPDQVVIAVPASTSAAGSGQIANAGLQEAFRRLEASFPGIRGIMAWSINWDSFQNSNSFVTENRAFLSTL